MKDYMDQNKGEDISKNIEDLKLTLEYIEEAIKKVGPSLDEEDREKYDELAQGLTVE